MRNSGFLPLAIIPALLVACSSPDADDSGGDARAMQDASSESESADAEAVNPVVAEAREALTDQLMQIGTDFGGSIGIAVIDVESGWTTGYAEDNLLPQQSVSKLWVALAALDMADNGALDLDESVTVRRENLTVFHQPIRTNVLRFGSVDSNPLDLMVRAITESDNTANDMLLQQVGGPQAVRDVLEAKGLTDIRFGPGERAMQSAIAGLEWRQEYAYTREGFFDARDDVPDTIRRRAFERYLGDPVDGATPRAIAQALALLARGDLLSPESTARLIAILEDTKSGPRRLKAGAPEGWTVAHKTGTGQFYNGRQSGYNDVGLVTSPEGRAYAIAIMIGVTRRPTPERMDMMQSVTRVVTEFDEALPDNQQ